jgi:alkylation response protein AidB-like acyl-CoA dehydrogenase
MKIKDSEFKESIQQWIAQEITPNIQRWMTAPLLPIRQLIASLSSANLLVQGWPAPYGDSDIRKQLYLHYALARQPIGGVGLCIASHIDIGARCLLEKASPLMSAQWLPQALSGAAIFSLAMTEPDAGSDLQGIQFSAQKCESGWQLNGIKRGVTNLPFADVAIVLTRTHPNRSPFSYTLFLVPLNTPGISREVALPTLGYEGCLGGIRADNAIVSADNVIGLPGSGLILLMQHLEVERLFVSARMLGMSEYLFENLQLISNSLVSCGTSDKAPFGASFGAEQTHLIARLKIQLMAFSSYFELCVENFSRGVFPVKDSASLKYLGSRLLESLASAFATCSGAEGYLQGSSAEKCNNEALGLSLAGGSEEIMLALIGNALH